MSSHHHLNPPSGEVVHINQLSENIGSLYLSDDYFDVTLIVAGQRFNGHKLILAARSQYFRALLYGGLRESEQTEIELKETTLPAFKELLKYIYTGHLSLVNQREETILDILSLAHQYGFVDLEMAISDYLKEILDIKNVCLIFDATRLYQLSRLTKVCYEYMDTHAIDIIKHDSFLQLSAGALHDLISRDSFYAPEIDIFLAVQSWVKANPDVDANQVLGQVRLCLISITDLLNVVRPTGLVTPEAILDAIAARTHTRDSELNYRGRLLVDENVAHPDYDADVLQGEMRSFLLDGDTHSYDMEQGYTRHVINDPKDHGIVIKLGTPSIINHIKMLLWDRDLRSYSYYIEVSNDQKDWVKLIDYSDYFCRSWQYLYFEPRVVYFIRILGTNNTVNKVFHVVSFEAYYTNHTENLSMGFIIPTLNVATMDRSACVIEGVSRSRNALLNGQTSNYDWDIGYTCHQIGSGVILVQLGQPYIIDSMRLLLWDCDDRSYSYYIEVSGNSRNWERVIDKSEENCRSWQTLRFSPPRRVVFIRIVGTHNTANEVFHCVHFECPARRGELEGDNPKSPNRKGKRQSTSQSTNTTALTASSVASEVLSPEAFFINPDDPFNVAAAAAAAGVEGGVGGGVGGVVRADSSLDLLQ
ncbi:BTB/POZ domain-containing protein 9 [Microplitis mediator]|uniref:BTB/POZ domain-containing protein 9 n=1 Tax=Microplitis mediator TaxID=375433 RepID=UPI0025542AD6|nr:BTB/POZ domain-containing protein 9 [Microplitis mediator]XP_057329518.1 BTB/POZ domain-containing protein 9 [Microplitis mediator]XP_057329519.1 BTB/POZ domain-containing protein 9 [Microplitis mediator]XP_057329520.1 BTB/POZ domain-containing protein 9 [Microplitis mediator]